VTLCPTCHEEPGIVGEPCLSQGDERDPWHNAAEDRLTCSHVCACTSDDECWHDCHCDEPVPDTCPECWVVRPCFCDEETP
jgi:hypothetical protein